MFPISHSITVNGAIIAYATGFFHIFNNFVTIQSPLKVTIILLFFRDFMQNIDL